MALTPVDVLGALEEPWHVVLQDGQGLVELLEHTDHRVVLLNILLGLPHRYLCVEPPGNVEVSCVLVMTCLQYWLVAGTGASWGTQHRTLLTSRRVCGGLAVWLLTCSRRHGHRRTWSVGGGRQSRPSADQGCTDTRDRSSPRTSQSPSFAG